MSNNASSSAEVFFLYKLGITVPKDVTHLCVDPSVKFIPAAAFDGCRHLKEVVLPEGLQEIGKEAFYFCFLLERINFPTSLTAIGYRAFYCCVKLREAKLIGGILDIGAGAFAGCKSLERINIIPSTVTAIGDDAFDNCTSLREVKLRKGIHAIGKGAFRRCLSLERINFPSTLTAIGAYAFGSCTSLMEVDLLGGIQDIGAGAFQDCTSLGGIMIPSRAFIIETGANHNCHLLTDGTIPSTNLVQVMIASECLEYVSLADLTEVAKAINAIINDRERTREENLERIRALFAHYELMEAMTILELALWKAKVDNSDDLNARTREQCRIKCGADIMIPNVLPFL